jgi:hypothetical protein
VLFRHRNDICRDKHGTSLLNAEAVSVRLSETAQSDSVPWADMLTVQIVARDCVRSHRSGVTLEASQGTSVSKVKLSP